MKKTFALTAASAVLLTLTACGGATEEAAEGTTEEATETAAVEECTEETLLAKATEASEKMQEMASDPAAMQELGAKLQEIQAQAQEEGYDITAACAAYDEILAAG